MAKIKLKLPRGKKGQDQAASQHCGEEDVTQRKNLRAVDRGWLILAASRHTVGKSMQTEESLRPENQST